MNIIGWVTQILKQEPESSASISYELLEKAEQGETWAIKELASGDGFAAIAGKLRKLRPDPGRTIF